MCILTSNKNHRCLDPIFRVWWAHILMTFSSRPQFHAISSKGSTSDPRCLCSRERWATIHVIIDDALCHNLLCACTFLPTRHRFDMGCLITNNGSPIIQMLLQTWFWLDTWVPQLMPRRNRPWFCWFTSCHMLLQPWSFIRDFNNKLLVQSKKCRGWSFRGLQVIFYFHIAK